MIRCTFCLNGNQLSNLSCPGIGFFPAYSGTGTSRNDPDAVAVPSIGPLPTGLYYIVTRGTGGVVTMVSDSLASFISGSDRSIWFALYRHDSQIDDYTFIGHVRRGNFRLHPAGYQGVSEGCITLPRLSDFMLLRAALLNTPTIQVTASLTAFGTVQVY
ncbi:DUF2778 domain-containing protein [Raoultella ornithinolytica]|uniref:Tlde1 domain-containing protein n=1 Tax=Raoultella ornithinolytica TaxID=54291 RepID=A0A855F812_RAOOR|nr:DUF2778 domain-containing protein [Raoultella ornithinolytica]ASI57547.1 hypothetical protein CA210_04490 [Raoultella ornithinolytica]AYW53422.1 DUF2778 domain-containing protein [Raoultella ornithinolytica]EJD6653755.1 DUF2778 domain-containing protein [Raoultella ornithinolytica]EKQ8000437.1 DUF2778 domain-containing protein [Raoultella ornithinolytica]EKT9522353.1 DUF2778 domain-containing protein [Raoultella ornithinolytica]